MSLVAKLKRIITRKRGQAHLNIPNKQDLRTFRCRDCGKLLKILKVDLAAHYIHPEIRGLKIPKKLGCPRCDSAKVWTAIALGGYRWCPMNVLQRRTNLPMARIYRALKWREDRRIPSGL